MTGYNELSFSLWYSANLSSCPFLLTSPYSSTRPQYSFAISSFCWHMHSKLLLPIEKQDLLSGFIPITIVLNSEFLTFKFPTASMKDIWNQNFKMERHWFSYLFRKHIIFQWHQQKIYQSQTERKTLRTSFHRRVRYEDDRGYDNPGLNSNSGIYKSFSSPLFTAMY